jgi:hypothetical protein
VVNRSPEIILIVDDDAWNQMTRAMKVRAIEDAGVTAGAVGYRRVEIRSSTRLKLAVWQRGEELEVGGE